MANAGRYGFYLAGGYAVQEHGFLDRPSEDIDLFTTAAGESKFPDALAAVMSTYENDGLDVSPTFSGSSFARLHVTEPTAGTVAKVALGVDWRVPVGRARG